MNMARSTCDAGVTDATIDSNPRLPLTTTSSFQSAAALAGEENVGIIEAANSSTMDHCGDHTAEMDMVVELVGKDL